MKNRLLYIKTWFRIHSKRLLSYWLPKQTDYLKFAIICPPRTGSTLLHTYLNTHRSIFSYGEVLRRSVEKGTSPDVQKDIFKPHGKNIKAVGLKVFLDYKSDTIFGRFYDQIVYDTNIRIILLQRNDIEKQFHSLKLAEQTGEWSTIKGSSEENIQIDANEFEQFKSKVAVQILIAEDDFKHHEVFRLNYEELTNNPDVLLEVQKFLNINPQKLWTLLRKQGL